MRKLALSHSIIENKVYQSKKEIRKAIINLRNSLSQDDIEAKSEIIQEKLWKLIEDHKFKSVMFYIAFGSEVKTQNCIDKALKMGLNVIVPICIESKSNHNKPDRDLLPSKLLDPSSELAVGTFGVLEPKPEFRRSFSPNKIELVVVPGVAFDKKYHRIGYGAGYYDRFLPKCSNSLFVALAYEIQIVEDVFHSEWDVPVDYIITEKMILKNNKQVSEKTLSF
ncbi:MAG: 5-formyltetrahydrofolate cyclo-ligase [Candidatus Poribacteria bacterium]